MQLSFILSPLNSFNSYSSLRWVTLAAGCVIALLAMSSDAFKIIGHDSVLYIQTAALYNQFGFQTALQYYDWPVYPIIIAIVHNFTGLTLVNAAHVINLVLVLVMADAFCRLYWELFPAAKFRWLPIVIFLAYTGINDYRVEIVRDWGFWAFGLLTLLYFVKAYKQGQHGDFLCWQFFALVALLFRLEALAFMFMLPLLFLMPKLQPLKFIESSSIFCCIAFILLLYFEFNDTSRSHYWGRLAEFLTFFNVLDLLAEFKQESLEHAQRIFSHHAKNHALVFMVTGLIGVLWTKIVTKIGAVYLFIGLTGWFKSRAVIEKRTLFLILFFVFVALFPLLVFFAKTKILAGRYVIFTVLILLLLVAYYFEQLILYCLDNKKNSLLVVLLGLLLINLSIGIIHTKVSNIYLKELGLWTDQTIPKQARVLANEIKLCFYSNRQPNCHQHTIKKNTALVENSLLGYDYLLWRFVNQDKKVTALLGAGKLQQIYTIEGGKPGSYAALYKIKK